MPNRRSQSSIFTVILVDRHGERSKSSVEQMKMISVSRPADEDGRGVEQRRREIVDDRQRNYVRRQSIFSYRRHRDRFSPLSNVRIISGGAVGLVPKRFRAEITTV